jgi:hypothetical protein
MECHFQHLYTSDLYNGQYAGEFDLLFNPSTSLFFSSEFSCGLAWIEAALQSHLSQCPLSLMQ